MERVKAVLALRSQIVILNGTNWRRKPATHPELVTQGRHQTSGLRSGQEVSASGLKAGPTVRRRASRSQIVTLNGTTWAMMKTVRGFRSITVAARKAIVLFPLVLSGQWPTYPTAHPALTAPAPKTPEDKPDFTGIWRNSLPARLGEFGDRIPARDPNATPTGL